MKLDYIVQLPNDFDTTKLERILTLVCEGLIGVVGESVESYIEPGARVLLRFDPKKRT